MAGHSQKSPFFDQPKAVWATAFACVVGFMSIGLVDPILTSIAAGLQATPTQVSLLFTSYFFVTSSMMLVTGFVSSRLGGRKTLLLGAGLIVVFAALAGTSNSVSTLVLYRGGWGFGNAFFIVTALSVLVASSRGGTAAAVLIYEAAMGLGLSAGPLIGAALGAHSWRYPFFGTATLMGIGLIAIAAFLPELPKPKQKTALSAPIRALGHPGLLVVSLSGFFYYYAFFTVLAFVPFVLNMSAYGVGIIFFGWGVLLAIFSVFLAPRLQARFGTMTVMTVSLVLFAALLLIIGDAERNVVALGVLLSGALMGVCNTLYTELALSVSDVPRPVASAGYNFLRWFAGVIAPFLAPTIASRFGNQATFGVAALAALIAPMTVLLWRAKLGVHEQVTELAPVKPATLRPGPVIAAIDGSESDERVLARTIELGRQNGTSIMILHARMIEVFDEDATPLESEAHARRIVEQALARAERAGVAAETKIIETSTGEAARSILEHAQAAHAHFLVLGVPHEHDLSDMIHGSLAAVVQHLDVKPMELVTVN